jgi:hypothetical protein
MGLIWATFAMVIIRIQSALMSNFPWPPEVYDYIDMPALLETVYGVISTLFPFVFLIALLYIISGILQLSDKPAYKNIGYAAAILNIIWYLSYAISMYVEFVPAISSMSVLPGRWINLVMIAGLIMNALFYCGYPVFLIIYLTRGGQAWDTLDTDYTT